jgi:GNAT superfamily N-acetyltransferase
LACGLAEPGAKKRLDGILVRYRENERGAGFRVFPGDQPENLEAILDASRALHCRKYFPAMYRDLAAPLPEVETLAGLAFCAVTDYDQFRRVEHPAIGRISTKFRRMRLETQRHLAARDPRRCWDLMASLDGVPAGVCTVFLGERHGGLFDMGVPERLRNRGIGHALLRHACAFAQARSAAGVALIATDPGYPMYGRVGFREVAQVGYWYTAYP